MSRRRVVASIMGILGTVALAAAVWVVASNGTIEIAVPGDEIQRRVDERMPFRGSRGPLSYEVQRVAVTPREDGRVGFDSGFTVEAMGRAGEGRLVGSGRLDYADGAFFLREFDAETVHLSRLDSPRREPSRVRQAIGDLARRAAERAGVDDEARELAEATREALAERARGTLVSGVRARLDSHPVYRLRADSVKHELARLALREVRTGEDGLVVVLDPLTAAGRVLAYVAMVAASVIIALGLLVAIGRGGGGPLLGLLAVLPN